MERCLQEFRIRGVKTNIPFLTKLMMHPTFVASQCTTGFIDETPDLPDLSLVGQPLKRCIVDGEKLALAVPCR